MKNIIILALLWGPSAVSLKILTNYVPPITIVTVCGIISTIILSIKLKIEKIDNLKITNLSKSTIRQGFIVGFFGNAFPFVLLSYSMHYIDSIWMGISNALVPIFVAIFSNFYLKHEHLTKTKSLGILTAFAGVLYLTFNSINNGSANQTIGLTLSFIAALSYAVAITYAKKSNDHINPILRSFIHVASGLIYLIPLAIFIENPIVECIFNIKSVLALFIVAVPGTAIAFIYYYKIVNKLGATMLSMVNYIVPVLKIILGAIILHENVTGDFVLAISFILAGIYLVQSSVKTINIKVT